MLAPSWIALFKLIPANLHDTLALITTTSIEVMVQRLLRVEQDYVVFRGRMSGTMDSGRVMIMPYDQISNVAFNKRMAEEEVDAIFGNLGGWVPERIARKPGEGSLDDTATGEAAKAEKEDVAQDNTGEPAAALAPAPLQPAAAKPEHASKSILLARLRARLNGGTKK